MIYFLFPGQGSQSVSMGKDLYENFEVAQKRLDQANDILGIDLKSICFEGPDEKLKSTENAQPALFTIGYIIYEIAKLKGLRPNVAAGHSLGEYTAIAAAKGFDFETGLKLVRKRGELMSKAKSGAMAAVIGMDKKIVDEICQKVSRDKEVVVPANYNTPQQIVISGTKKAVSEAGEKLKKEGAKRVVELAVSGAFHSPLMKEAAEQIKGILDSSAINDTEIPVISNVTSEYVQKGSDIKRLLYKQLFSPVNWTGSFLDNKEGTAYEMGPGKVLMGLLRKINRKIKVIPLSSKEEIDKVLN